MAGETDSGRQASGGLIARAAKTLGIAAEGVIMSGAIAFGGIVLIGLGAKSIGAIAVLIAIAVAMFFRDPDRFPTRTDGVVISGADGKVTDVSEVAFPTGVTAARCHRVSVFMSPLNVHVNRAPVAGIVTVVEHTAGEFRAAFRDDASERNERNLIAITDADGRAFAMLQVAGYLARRIVCRLRAHDKIQAAQRIGLIMFGSRVDHFFPIEYRVMVTTGQRVRAGETIIGVIEP